MGYDLHIVRTKDWTQASKAPITKQEVEELIAKDPELAWSTSDYVDMKVETGVSKRYYMITWKGESCFWWYQGQIECSNPDESQQVKLVQMACLLNANAVGDDGERYEIKQGFGSEDKLVVIPES